MDQTSLMATNAAKVFLEQHPSYIVCQENSRVLMAEIQKLVDEENADPCAVVTYEKAFSRCWQDLKLHEIPQPKSPEELTMEEIAALSGTEQDKLPTAILRRFANWELQERKQRPQYQLSEADAMLGEIFESNRFAASNKNKAAVGKWMNERGLDYLIENLQLAIDTIGDQLDLSDTALADLPADEYRKAVVEPEFRERQAKQPKPEPSRLPLGVRTTRYLHER